MKNRIRVWAENTVRAGQVVIGDAPENDTYDIDVETARAWYRLAPLAAMAHRRAVARNVLRYMDLLTECAYCGADVMNTEPPTNEEEWKHIAIDHADDCEWIETRAHSYDAC